MTSSLKARALASRRLLTDTRATTSVSTDKLTERRIAKARSHLRALRSSSWNGFSEITDEAMIGHVLFEVDGQSENVDFIGKFHNQEKERTMVVVSVNDFENLRIGLNRRLDHPSVFAGILQCLTNEEVDRYFNESLLVGNLIRKMATRTPVRERWLPRFSPSLVRLEELINSKPFFLSHAASLPALRGSLLRPKTLGQWFLGAITLRIRSRENGGLSLKTLLFALAWIAKAMLDDNHLCIHASGVAIFTWITSSTCDDCMIKTLMNTSNDTVFEYRFHRGDSFSEYLRFNGGLVRLHFGPCSDKSGISNASRYLQPEALRTIGKHSFLISPSAGKMICVEVRFSENVPFVSYRMTERQAHSLLSVLELHARVLKGYHWRSEAEIYDSWIHERRIDLSSHTDDLTRVFAVDLRHVLLYNANLSTMVGHLLPLLLTKRLSLSLITALSASRRAREEVHAFLIRHVFTTAPTPDEQALAESLLDEVIHRPDEIKRNLLMEISAEPPLKRMRLSIDNVDLREAWGISNCDPEVIDDHYTGEEVTFTRTIVEEQPESAEPAPSDADILRRYMFDAPSTSTELGNWRPRAPSITSTPTASASDKSALDDSLDDEDINSVTTLLDQSFRDAEHRNALEARASTSDGFVTPLESVSTATLVRHSPEDE